MAELSDAVASMRDYHAGRELTDIELVEQAVAGAIQGIDDHHKVEALRTAIQDAMDRLDDKTVDPFNTAMSNAYAELENALANPEPAKEPEEET